MAGYGFSLFFFLPTDYMAARPLHGSTVICQQCTEAAGGAVGAIGKSTPKAGVKPAGATVRDSYGWVHLSDLKAETHLCAVDKL